MSFLEFFCVLTLAEHKNYSRK